MVLTDCVEKVGIAPETLKPPESLSSAALLFALPEQISQEKHFTRTDGQLSPRRSPRVLQHNRSRAFRSERSTGSPKASLGVTVLRAMTDNGSCYRLKAFGNACRALRLRHTTPGSLASVQPCALATMAFRRERYSDGNLASTAPSVMNRPYAAGGTQSPRSPSTRSVIAIVLLPSSLTTSILRASSRWIKQTAWKTRRRAPGYLFSKWIVSSRGDRLREWLPLQRRKRVHAMS